jgi:hypothetical protein
MAQPQTLAQTIIYGKEADLEQALRAAPKLDEIDEYGYSPLIQAAIVNSESKAKILLKAGASVDFPDLTGRTALNWAASNSNRPFCELLLQHGADPNSYSYAGQPTLVIPFLKKQKPIYQLLFNNHASLDFAQDFINAKVLGHRFELEGRVDVVDTKGIFTEVELEGFYLEFSLNLLTSSLTDFRNNFGSKHLRKYFSKIDVIINGLRNAIELLRYQHYLVDVAEHQSNIDALLDHEPLILPIVFDGHAITLIKFWEWFIRCDRGAFGREHGTTIVYLMRKTGAATKGFLRTLLYKRQRQEHINTGLIDYLGLNEMYQLPVSVQTAGNCTWANVEAVIPAMLFIFLLEEHNGKDVELCQKEALDFYNHWVEWDKNRALHFCIESFYTANPARKAAKAALLAAILFQTCKYGNVQDRERAEKIFAILKIPEYQYILQSYIKVFSQDLKNELLKNLYNLMDDFGVRVDDSL